MQKTDVGKPTIKVSVMFYFDIHSNFGANFYFSKKIVVNCVMVLLYFGILNIFFVQTRLRTEVPHTTSSDPTGVRTHTSRS